MDETSELIARTREEIARATLIEQLNQSFGAITPEMMEIVGGVKIDFVWRRDNGGLRRSPVRLQEAVWSPSYRSPLEN